MYVRRYIHIFLLVMTKLHYIIVKFDVCIVIQADVFNNTQWTTPNFMLRASPVNNASMISYMLAVNVGT